VVGLLSDCYLTVICCSDAVRHLLGPEKLLIIAKGKVKEGQALSDDSCEQNGAVFVSSLVFSLHAVECGLTRTGRVCFVGSSTLH